MKNPNNKLNFESSPYLLQHAENPVNWWSWNPESLEMAKKEDKLLLISIGYSTCHWCHVMAHESFEDEEVAKIMNEGFINIKIDREERPDLDQVYMDAVQLMTGQGGWPLNIVALPDGRPVWGGTYFPKTKWKESLRQLVELFKTNPGQMTDYAGKLHQGLREMQLIPLKESQKEFPKGFFENVFSEWEQNLDWEMGGTNRAPKFPMPNNYHFLLRYSFQSKNSAHSNSKKWMDFLNLTLQKMAFGGIYDHLGGGFSRYSIDKKWHVPHFEKMLYDNAQLVSLYCDAFLLTKNPLYKQVATQTLDFALRELYEKNTGFYSALDADSPDENGISKEGAFYVWPKKELEKTLGKDFDLFAEFYNINAFGFWEDHKYVLIRNKSLEEVAKKFSLSPSEAENILQACKKKLFQIREQRPRPGLDDKILTSWNALMIKAFLDAHRVFGGKKYLDTALKTATFLSEDRMDKNGRLFHSHPISNKHGKGFLEDYAFTIEAFLSLYENTFEEIWLSRAETLIKTAFRNYFDKEKGMFYFTSNRDSDLVSRTMELQDNVLPSSNSVMAKNLFKLSRYFGNMEFRDIAHKMLLNILAQAEKYPQAYSNWLDLALNFEKGFYEIALVGKDFLKLKKGLDAFYIPNKIIAGTSSVSKLPLLSGRYQKDKSLIYVCENGTCQMPVKNVGEALRHIG